MTGVMVKKANEEKKERIVFLPFFAILRERQKRGNFT